MTENDSINGAGNIPNPKNEQKEVYINDSYARGFTSEDDPVYQAALKAFSELKLFSAQRKETSANNLSKEKSDFDQ